MSQWEIVVAALAVLAGVWGHLRAVVGWLNGLVVVKHWIDFDVASVVSSYLAAHGRHHAREASFGTIINYVKPLKQTTQVVFEFLPSHARMMWHRGRPLWVDRVKSPDDEDYPFTVSFVRGTVNWSELLREAFEWAREKKDSWECVRHCANYHHGRTLGSEMAEKREKGERVTSRQVGWDSKSGKRLLHWREEDLGHGRGAAFAGLALSPELRAMLDEVRLWYGSSVWYAEHGVAWRRGYLHHGDPGTGKTTMARAEAEEFDLPVHVMDLATMSNEDLREAWAKAVADAPCMILIEDVDAVFHGRENVAPGGGMMASGGLTFDALLNCIDGIERANGVLLVVTTNHLEHVDPALRRAGRIDRVVEFLPLDYDGRYTIARRIVGDEAEAHRLAGECDGWTAAQFTEECCRKAIAERFENNSPYR